MSITNYNFGKGKDNFTSYWFNKLLKIRDHAAKNRVSKRQPLLLPLQILTRKVGVNASKYLAKERKKSTTHQRIEIMKAKYRGTIPQLIYSVVFSPFFIGVGFNKLFLFSILMSYLRSKL